MTRHRARLNPALAALAVSALGLIGGCAGGPRDGAWTGGDPAALAGDMARCRSEAAGLGLNDAESYSDPRYGAAQAMASRLERESPQGMAKLVRRVAMERCMGLSGWRPTAP